MTRLTWALGFKAPAELALGVGPRLVAMLVFGFGGCRLKAFNHFAFDLLARQSFDLAQLGPIRRSHKGDRTTGGACPARSTNSMNIVLSDHR